MTLTHAMVLAAGLGKRLRPLTDTIPKPLVPVAGTPLIGYCLDQLETQGIKNIVVNSSYLADKLEEYLLHREQKSDAEILCLREDAPLETGGGIANAMPYLGNGPFVSLNSDVIVLPSAGEHYLSHMQKAWQPQFDVLMLLLPRERAYGYDGAGDFVVDENGLRRRKPDEISADYIFTGVQMLHPRLFDSAPDGAFSMNVFYDRLLNENGYFGDRFGYVVHEGDWLHVGDKNGLDEAEGYFSKHRAIA